MRIICCSVALLLMFGSCTFSKHSSSSGKRSPGNWQVSPIVIDGKNNDWPSPYPEYDDKAMLGYIVTNDKENLYVTVETGDAATQLKILKNGLTMWLDKTGGKNELTAINYPIPEDVNGKSGTKDHKREEMFHLQPAQGKKRLLELQDRVKEKLEGAKEFSLQGFKACNYQFDIPGNDSCGIMVRMAMDQDNELIWEAIIPFRSFYFKSQIGRADAGKELSICFETTASERPKNEPGAVSSGRPERAGGMRPSISLGGGGMGMALGGGGMRGPATGAGRSGAAQPDNTMESLYKSTKTWKKFGIAFHE